LVAQAVQFLSYVLDDTGIMVRLQAGITLVMHVLFAFVFDRNFEILILWNSGRGCRVTTAIVSNSN
jgi:hypothetical protein